jgi:uncharacterized protein YciI
MLVRRQNDMLTLKEKEFLDWLREKKKLLMIGRVNSKNCGWIWKIAFG